MEIEFSNLVMFYQNVLTEIDPSTKQTELKSNKSGK